MKKWLLFIIIVVTACRGGQKNDPILNLGAEESLKTGRQLMAEEKYAKARDYLLHAFEVQPNSAGGREALLLAADSLYRQGGSQRLIEAESKYRDFISRFPTSDKIPYVQYQIGNCLVDRLRRPDRDQGATVKAIEAFQHLQDLYPTSEYAVGASEKITELRQRLAEHDFVIGEFYLRYGLAKAAIDRWEGILEKYPDYEMNDKVFLKIGVAYMKLNRLDEAAAWFYRLKGEFPESGWIDEMPKNAPTPKQLTENNS